MAKILIVDDDQDFIEINKMILEEKGYEIFSAHNKAEAYEQLEAVKFDLIILDLMMEHFDDGCSISYNWKTDEKYKDIPIIIASAVASETGIKFSLKSKEEQKWIKADAFLDKPVSPDDLIGTVRKLLKEEEND
jgi:CheY-like chemotaxis protein